MLTVDDHRRRRQEFFERFGHLWPDTLSDEYDILEPYPLRPEEIAGILEAAAAVREIYASILGLARTFNSETLANLGLPSEVMDLVICDRAAFSELPLQRMDFGVNRGKYSLLELNCDVPGLVIEAFSLNGYACQHAGLTNPNEHSERLLKKALTEAIRNGLTRDTRQHRASVVFALDSRCKRDAAISRYLCSLVSGEPDFRVQSIEVGALLPSADGLYDRDGERIEVLHRMHSLRFLGGSVFGRDRNSIDSAGGALSGQVIHDLVGSGRLTMINSPIALLLESKAIQVIIWGLHERGLFFTPQQHELVENHMLPCYLDPPKGRYAVKPAYGSEGDSVSIVDSVQGRLHRSRFCSFDDTPMVYQRYIELPKETLMTEVGPQALTLVTSCFLVAGEPTGICLRAGPAITDSSAWIVPVGSRASSPPLSSI